MNIDEFQTALPRTVKNGSDRAIHDWFKQLHSRGITLGNNQNASRIRAGLIEFLQSPPYGRCKLPSRLDTNYLVDYANLGLFLFEISGTYFEYEVLYVPGTIPIYPLVFKLANRVEWRFDNVVHNINDLPAIVHSNGEEEWFRMGQPWRVDGLPNTVTLDGVSWKDAFGKYKAPNEECPYYIGFNGQMLWYIDHNGSEMVCGIAGLCPHDKAFKQNATVGNRSIFWSNSNGLHRINDMPARITYTGKMQWIFEGVKYKRPREQPTTISYLLTKYQTWTVRKVWYIEGKKHRYNDLPAIEVSTLENGVSTVTSSEWFENGVRSRPSGPAVVRGEKSEYWYKGIRTADPGQYLSKISQKAAVDTVSIEKHEDSMEEDDTDCFACGEEKAPIYTSVTCGHIFYACVTCVGKLRMICPYCQTPVQMFMRSFKV